jgi:hypothetical protein
MYCLYLQGLLVSQANRTEFPDPRSSLKLSVHHLLFTLPRLKFMCLTTSTWKVNVFISDFSFRGEHFSVQLLLLSNS